LLAKQADNPILITAGFAGSAVITLRLNIFQLFTGAMAETFQFSGHLTF
jgi:hypothetical protein